MKGENSTWAYINFSESPNIVGKDLKRGGYGVIKANVYIDGVKEVLTLIQETGSKELYVKHPTWLINKLKDCDDFRINLRWHGNSNVVWSFRSVRFKDEYESMLRKFNNL
ncbi:hypothetical protein [Chitinivibrio alkaliphilus]|uniref:Uncharacterized protein n=1 Tax=Chitinivibrio alkaliphilus ACht1 TaxID=1313304 RepID=U7D5B3_9BACT|nr:hypothetical protein [Chitinivibrio alkaliphilus]ERP31138.1 hypothetical protein CALK_2019 [Chitinivibrio alkaliphilus ACht1]